MERALGSFEFFNYLSFYLRCLLIQLSRVPSLPSPPDVLQYMDPRGRRFTTESFRGWGSAYRERMLLSASYFVYALMRLRHVFIVDDPLSSLPCGALMAFKANALDFYLFCEEEGGMWLDAVPMAPSKISDFTRVITSRMTPQTGLPVRSARAHRHAAGTNTTQRALLRWGVLTPHLLLFVFAALVRCYLP